MCSLHCVLVPTESFLINLLCQHFNWVSCLKCKKLIFFQNFKLTLCKQHIACNNICVPWDSWCSIGCVYWGTEDPGALRVSAELYSGLAMPRLLNKINIETDNHFLWQFPGSLTRGSANLPSPAVPRHNNEGQQGFMGSGGSHSHFTESTAVATMPFSTASHCPEGSSPITVRIWLCFFPTFAAFPSYLHQAFSYCRWSLFPLVFSFPLWEEIDGLRTKNEIGAEGGKGSVGSKHLSPGA